MSEEKSDKEIFAELAQKYLDEKKYSSEEEKEALERLVEVGKRSGVEAYTPMMNMFRYNFCIILEQEGKMDPSINRKHGVTKKKVRKGKKN